MANMSKCKNPMPSQAPEIRSGNFLAGGRQLSV